MKTVLAIPILLVLGGIPLVAQAGDSKTVCTGLDKVVPEGNEWLLTVNTPAPKAGKFFVFMDPDAAKRDVVGIWEKLPGGQEPTKLRYAPYQCTLYRPDGSVHTVWDQIPADTLIIGTGTKAPTPPAP